MKTIKVFTKDNCAPCESVTKYFEEKGTKVEFIKAFAHPDQASKYRIMSVPSTLLINENDEVLKQSIGFNSEQLDEIVEDLSK